jgi:hypothetical protein
LIFYIFAIACVCSCRCLIDFILYSKIDIAFLKSTIGRYQSWKPSLCFSTLLTMYNSYNRLEYRKLHLEHRLSISYPYCLDNRRLFPKQILRTVWSRLPYSFVLAKTALSPWQVWDSNRGLHLSHSSLISSSPSNCMIRFSLCSTVPIFANRPNTSASSFTASIFFRITKRLFCCH